MNQESQQALDEQQKQDAIALAVERHDHRVQLEAQKDRAMNNRLAAKHRPQFYGANAC